MAVKSTELLNVSRVLAGVRARVVVVYLAALVPALAMAALQPVWSRVDEAQHADVLAQYAHGVVPVEGVTRLQPEIVAVDQATGSYRWYPPGSGPAPAERDPQSFVPPPQNASAEAKRAWMVRHIWGYSYEAMQPPLYYLLAEPDWVLGARFGGTLGAIYAARLFSAIIAASLAPIAYLLALMIRPGAERMGLVAAGFAALLPGYVLNSTQITNDGLAAVIGAGLTVVAVKGARDGWTRPLAAVCGVLLGAAALTKLTTIGLVPLVGAAFLWPGPQPLRSRLALGAMAATVAALVVAPWLLFNVHTYGQPVPSQATRDVLGSVFAAPSATKSYLVSSARNVFDEFVVGEPFGIMPLTRLLVWLMEALVLIAAVGMWLSRKRLRLEWLLVMGCGGEFLWVLGTPFLSGIGGLMPGRYVYPIAAAAFVVIAAGLEGLPAMLATVARVATAAGAADGLFALVLLANTQFGLVTHHPVAPVASDGTIVHAQAEAAGLDVVVDRMWVAADGRTMLVHVTLTDRAHQPADFPPVPTASTGSGTWLWADYSGSTPFPERLQPGQSKSGWLRFTSTEGAAVTNLMLTYTPVSTDGYSTVDTLSVAVTP